MRTGHPERPSEATEMRPRHPERPSEATEMRPRHPERPSEARESRDLLSGSGSRSGKKIPRFARDDKNPARADTDRGRIDRFIRRYNGVSYGLAVLALYALGATALGLALVPAVWLVERGAPPLWPPVRWYESVALAVLIAAAFFVWGFALLVVVPIYNLILPTRLRPFRGGYFTVAAVPWYLHNGLFYLVRFTFLPFVTLTPFGTLFLRAMGMKMGKRPRITTENISDPCMITLGDDVVIGGSAHVFCHYGGGGHLVIAPVHIGSRATIGLKATVMGDVVVGDGATILPHSVLLPGTRVGPGERWGGVPARRISREEWDTYKLALGALDEAASEPLTRRPRRRAYIKERTLAERPK